MECNFPLCHRHAEKNGYCIGHRIYAAAPPPGEKPQPKQKPIPKKSSPRKEQDKVYNKARKAFLKLHPKCLAGFVGCTSKATEIHHKAGRVGLNYLNIGSWLAVCHHCHRQIELNPAQAKEKKLSSPRLNKKNEN